MTRIRILLYLGTIALVLAVVVAWYGFAFFPDASTSETLFDGDRALGDVQRQVAFGPRIPGSDGHASTTAWIESELAVAGWSVQRQTATSMGHEIFNVIALRNPAEPYILVGAHYDTRILADRDPDPELRDTPSPGANDGASGVAILLELARSLPPETVPIRLIFFDAEDNGRIQGWDWTLGSRAFVAEMPVMPAQMILVDMVGDSDLRISMERNSDPDLRRSIWAAAARLGHDDVFVPELGTSILDDHVPFLEAGIPAVDIIDLDYEYWHTTSDTPDKVSAESLQVVGDVLWTWLVDQGAAGQ
jgi:Zn-dependent M28 family amino/carboxypeptidase